MLLCSYRPWNLVLVVQTGMKVWGSLVVTVIVMQKFDLPNNNIFEKKLILKFLPQLAGPTPIIT